MTPGCTTEEGAIQLTDPRAVPSFGRMTIIDGAVMAAVTGALGTLFYGAFVKRPSEHAHGGDVDEALQDEDDGSASSLGLDRD